MDPVNIAEWAAVALAIIGNILIAYRRKQGFIAWMVANAVSVPIMLERGLNGFATLYVVFFGLAAFSLWKWSDERNEGN